MNREFNKIIFMRMQLLFHALEPYLPHITHISQPRPRVIIPLNNMKV